MAEPTPEDLRWSRIAALVLVLLGAAIYGLGQLSTDERFEALGFVVGTPIFAVGAITLAYTRIGPHIPDLRRRRGPRTGA